MWASRLSRCVLRSASLRAPCVRAFSSFAKPTTLRIGRTSTLPRAVRSLPGLALTRTHEAPFWRGLSTQSTADANKEGDLHRPLMELRDVSVLINANKALLKDVSLHFVHGAKIGVLGVNGSGKSSLLKVLAGRSGAGGVEFQGERVLYDSDLRIGYLEQEPELDESKTVKENVMEGVQHKLDLLARFEELNARFADPDVDMDALMVEHAEVQEQIETQNLWELDAKIEVALNALRCPPGERSLHGLSGGERRRVALCRLVLSEPDMLLLDEPTNHLDAESVAWLESFLREYRGTVICVTHDRYFLDNVVGWILEVDGGRCYPHKGNYESWLEAKETRLDQQERADKKAQALISKELQWLRRNKKKTTKARTKRLQDLQGSEKNLKTSASGALLIPPGPDIQGNVIRAHRLKCQIDDRVLFENLSFQVNAGDVLGIIGPNGVGKTQLIRMLAGDLEPAEGEVTLSRDVRLGYLSQFRDQLHPERAVWESIAGRAQSITVQGGKTLPIRAYVAQFNFQNEDQNKRIQDLSGGERMRVQLAKVMAGAPNVLFLDEPANDIDIMTLRKLEEGLQDYPGSAVIISHDRYLLDRLATQILAFETDGSISKVRGNYTAYLKHRRRMEREAKKHEEEQG